MKKIALKYVVFCRFLLFTAVIVSAFAIQNIFTANICERVSRSVREDTSGS